MRHSRMLRNIALCLVVLPLTLASACPPASAPVTITYEQVGACNGYKQTTGPGGWDQITRSAPAPTQPSSHSEILAIDNTQSGTDFAFDPEHINVSGQHVSTSLTLAQDFGLLKAVAITVPKGTHPGNNGIAVIKVSTGTFNGATKANQSDYLLQYRRAAGDPLVIMKKKNQRSWRQTDDCREIRF